MRCGCGEEAKIKMQMKRCEECVFMDADTSLCFMCDRDCSEWKSADKPPLGVEPKSVHDDRRAGDLADAIRRYLGGGLPIRVEWIEEYNELVGVE